MTKAKVAFGESRRGQALDRQVDDWHRGQRVSAYLEAMERVIEAITDPEEAAARQWYD
jgi:hypothetical protein